MDLPYIKNHISNVSEKIKEINQSNKSYSLGLSDFIKKIDKNLLNNAEIEINPNIDDITYYYWIYKRNYCPWMQQYNFIMYMNTFEDMFSSNLVNKDVEGIKFSLCVLFYFDTIMHN